MTTWIHLAIEIFGLLLVNGGFFYTINRKLKKVEVQEKEIDVIKKQDDEWQELYREEKERRIALEDEVIRLREKVDNMTKANGLLELKNQQLTWYRCTINNCPNRRPPHVFDHDGNELEACS